MQELQKVHQPVNLINELPPIPNKIYFTIGEVGELCDLKPHVLRYWEQEFSQLKPSKRRGNRRYYQHNDVLLIRQIRHLLYHQGYTIEGARLQLNNQFVKKTSGQHVHTLVSEVISELEDVIQELE